MLKSLLKVLAIFCSSLLHSVNADTNLNHCLVDSLNSNSSISEDFHALLVEMPMGQSKNRLDSKFRGKQLLKFVDGKFKLDLTNYDPNTMTYNKTGETIQVSIKRPDRFNPDKEEILSLTVVNSNRGFPSKMTYKLDSFDSIKGTPIQKETDVDFDMISKDSTSHCKVLNLTHLYKSNNKSHETREYKDSMCSFISSEVAPKFSKISKGCLESINDLSKFVSDEFKKNDIDFEAVPREITGSWSIVSTIDDYWKKCNSFGGNIIANGQSSRTENYHNTPSETNNTIGQ